MKMERRASVIQSKVFYHNHSKNGRIVEKNDKVITNFAPVYDSARGLMWNYSDENIKKIYKQGSKKIVTYVEEACARIIIEKNKQANHFQLIDLVKKL